MNKIFKFGRLVLCLATVILISVSFVLAQDDLPQRPDPPMLVNEFVRVMDPQQKAALEDKLVEFNNQTSTQIAIAIVPTLQGYDKADYAFKLAQKWGIGQKGKNNGILILVKPKTTTEKGEVFVAVGYGLEGVVPDAVARQALVGAELIPNFKQNDYYTGLDRATSVLMGLTKGEFTADQYVKSARKRGSSSPIGGAVLVLLIMGVFFVLRGRSSNYHGVSSGGSLLGTLLMMDMMRGSHRGSWNDFSGGGGFGGGSSDSGFGGFGGGDFGGGGAGGSW